MNSLRIHKLYWFFYFLFLTNFIFNVNKSFAVGFNHLVFFGDSLSDNGNLYFYDLGYLPKSPPYYKGRFSNGLVWSEYVAEHFKDTAQVIPANFAVGGETAIFHDPTGGYLPWSLSASVNSYLLESKDETRPTTLYVIWIGANDYQLGKIEDKNINQLTNSVTESIKKNIDHLAYYGGRHFLVMNLPDLSKTPFARAQAHREMLHTMTLMHNLKLQSVIDDLKAKYPDAKIVLYDIYSGFNRIFDDNKSSAKEYNLQIKNTTSACWPGAYTLQRNQNRLLQPLMNHMYWSQGEYRTPEVIKNNIKPHFYKETIGSDQLSEAINIASAAAEGQVPCSNPEEFLFWDHVHPTAVVHQLLATSAIVEIEKDFS